MNEVLAQLIGNPEKVFDLTKEELVRLDEELDHDIETLTALKKEARALLYDKVDFNGEIILDMQVSKAEKVIVNTTVEEAEKFGATIEQIDATQLTPEQVRQVNPDAVKTVVDAAAIRKLLKKGAVISGIERVGYLMIRPVVKSTDVDIVSQG